MPEATIPQSTLPERRPVSVLELRERIDAAKKDPKQRMEIFLVPDGKPKWVYPTDAREYVQAYMAGWTPEEARDIGQQRAAASPSDPTSPTLTTASTGGDGPGEGSGSTSEDLDGLKRPDLLKAATALGLKGTRSMGDDEIRAAIRSHDAEATEEA